MKTSSVNGLGLWLTILDRLWGIIAKFLLSYVGFNFYTCGLWGTLHPTVPKVAPPMV